MKKVLVLEDESSIRSFIVINLRRAGYEVRVLDYTSHALSSGTDAVAVAYVETEIGHGDDTRVIWGVGMHESIATAAQKAVIGAINRAARTDT